MAVLSGLQVSKRAEIKKFCTILPFSLRFTHPKQDFSEFSGKVNLWSHLRDFQLCKSLRWLSITILSSLQVSKRRGIN